MRPEAPAFSPMMSSSKDALNDNEDAPAGNVLDGPCGTDGSSIHGNLPSHPDDPTNMPGYNTNAMKDSSLLQRANANPTTDMATFIDSANPDKPTTFLKADGSGEDKLTRPFTSNDFNVLDLVNRMDKQVKYVDDQVEILIEMQHAFMARLEAETTKREALERKVERELSSVAVLDKLKNIEAEVAEIRLNIAKRDNGARLAKKSLAPDAYLLTEHENKMESLEDQFAGVLVDIRELMEEVKALATRVDVLEEAIKKRAHSSAANSFRDGPPVSSDR